MIDEPWAPVQFATSHDGVTWSAWMPLLDTDVDRRFKIAPFIRVRILIRGEWEISPVFSWELSFDGRL